MTAPLPANQGASEAGLDVAAVLLRIARENRIDCTRPGEVGCLGRPGWHSWHGHNAHVAEAQAAALAPLIAQREAEAVRVALEPVRELAARHLCERPDECAADGACMAWIPPRDLDAALAQAEATSKWLGKRASARWAYPHDLSEVRAEGEVIAYCDAPMVCIATEDGDHVWWRADLTRLSDETNKGFA